jgi:hypothetical protein
MKGWKFPMTVSAPLWLSIPAQGRQVVPATNLTFREKTLSRETKF